MTTAIDVDNMSPYLRDTVNEEILRKAGMVACSYMIENSDIDLESEEDWNHLKKETEQVIEALGIKLIPDNLPLACGHSRVTRSQSARPDPCLDCKNEKSRQKHAQQNNQETS